MLCFSIEDGDSDVLTSCAFFSIIDQSLPEPSVGSISVQACGVDSLREDCFFQPWGTRCLGGLNQKL